MEEEIRLAELDVAMKLLIASKKKKIESLTYEYGLMTVSKKATGILPEAFVHDLGVDVKKIGKLLAKLYHPDITENSNEYWSLLTHSELFNRFMQTQHCKLFRDIAKINENLRINIPPPFHRNHHTDLESCITTKAENLPERENYSVPIVQNHKYAYYKAYDGKDHIVANLTEEEKRNIITREILKNQADAQSIFLYTQAKRARRVILRQPEDNYFSRGETAADIYDLEQRQLGPPCCYSSDTPRVTTIGHATLLIQFPMEGVTILTDPVFHDLQTVLYPRKTEPAWMEDQMPLIDVILISHNHRDHVDEPSLQSLLPHQPLLLVPEGDAGLMRTIGFKHVIEHNTWQRTCLSIISSEDQPESLISFISVPANHWSCRGLNDANKSLFLGWVIASSARNGSIYFAGDTAELSVTDHEDILMNPNFPPVELNLVPGGPNHKRGTMKNTHASAADGIYSHFYHLDLRARKKHPFCDEDVGESDYDSNVLDLLDKEFCKTVFMHHNTFELGIDRFNEADYVREDLIRALEGEDVGGFVQEIADRIFQLSKFANCGHIIRTNVLNPKIGSTVLLRKNNGPP